MESNCNPKFAQKNNGNNKNINYEVYENKNFKLTICNLYNKIKIKFIKNLKALKSLTYFKIIKPKANNH